MKYTVFEFKPTANIRCDVCGRGMGQTMPQKVAKKISIEDGENSATIICHSRDEVSDVIEKAKNGSDQ